MTYIDILNEFRHELFSDFAALTSCADSTCTKLSRSGTVIHIISGRDLTSARILAATSGLIACLPESE
jgi:hypothetical protein